MNKWWAIKYDKCIECGRNDRPHAAKGLCERCYQRDEYFRKYGSHLERAKAIIAQLTELEKAYLAGFIDGEGCITAECPAIDGHNKPKAARARIMLAQTNEAIIEWLHVKLGGTVYKKQSQGNHKASYNWTLNGQRATLLLIAIYPHLMVKREQAELAIAFGKIRLGRTSIPITGDEKNQLAELKRRLMALNQRGIGQGKEVSSMADIKVDLDKKCSRCGKGGATQSGVCLKCIAKAIKNGEFDHILESKKRRV